MKYIHGSFTNYIYKKRWVVPKNFYKVETVNKGGRWSKKAKNLSTWFVNDPLYVQSVR